MKKIFLAMVLAAGAGSEIAGLQQQSAPGQNSPQPGQNHPKDLSYMLISNTQTPVRVGLFFDMKEGPDKILFYEWKGDPDKKAAVNIVMGPDQEEVVGVLINGQLALQVYADRRPTISQNEAEEIIDRYVEKGVIPPVIPPPPLPSGPPAD